MSLLLCSLSLLASIVFHSLAMMEGSENILPYLKACFSSKLNAGNRPSSEHLNDVICFLAHSLEDSVSSQCVESIIISSLKVLVEFWMT